MHQMRNLGPFGKVLKSSIKFRDPFIFRDCCIQSQKLPIFNQILEKRFFCLKWHKMHQMTNLEPFSDVLKIFIKFRDTFIFGHFLHTRSHKNCQFFIKFRKKCFRVENDIQWIK